MNMQIGTIEKKNQYKPIQRFKHAIYLQMSKLYQPKINYNGDIYVKYLNVDILKLNFLFSILRQHEVCDTILSELQLSGWIFEFNFSKLFLPH